MVNVALTLGSLLGLLNVILAIVYLVLSIALPLERRRIIGGMGIALYVAQAIIAPLFLLVSGAILIFQGWRLDPILQLAYLLLDFLVIYLAVKDVILFRLISSRNQR
jgi:small-conductance mechanosensitive channel